MGWLNDRFTIMTNYDSIFILGMKVHRATETVFKHLAIGALSRLHPLAVTEGLETIFPDIKKVVFINIALHKTSVNVGTGGNGAVNQYRADCDACTTEIEPVADLALV